MYKILLLLPFFLPSGPWLNAQNILRVSPVVNEGDYTNLQTAIDAAAPNDILMVYPGVYGSIQINKPLKIYGPGYRIPENPSLGINTIKQDAQLDIITFLSQSAGTEISGFKATRFIGTNVNNLLIRRNHFEGSFSEGSYLQDASAIIIEGNYFTFKTSTTEAEHVGIYENCNNIIIRNNLFVGVYNKYGIRMYTSNGSSQIAFYNNYVIARNTFHHSQVYNNIFGNSNGGNQWNLSGTNNYLANNMIGIQAGTFVSGTYSFDAAYQLAPGSPAIGAGVNGEDLGAFGGPTPYKLSGIPDIPLIYELNVPAEAPPGSIQINIKVRAEN